MAVPAGFTSANLSGKFTLNTKLTDMNKVDEMLNLQGVGWIKRKAAKATSVSLTIKHHVDAEGKERLDVDQTPGQLEERVLDGSEVTKSSPLLGYDISTSATRVLLATMNIESLKAGWPAEINDKGAVQLVLKPATGANVPHWTCVQAWGVDMIDGQLMHTRKFHFKGAKGEVVEFKMIYDYGTPIVSWLPNSD